VQIFGVETQFFQHHVDARGSLVVIVAIDGQSEGVVDQVVVGVGLVIAGRGRSANVRMAARLR
jgi:hypothetical protein